MFIIQQQKGSARAHAETCDPPDVTGFHSAWLVVLPVMLLMIWMSLLTSTLRFCLWFRQMNSPLSQATGLVFCEIFIPLDSL